jgi:hypothetical protein
VVQEKALCTALVKVGGGLLEEWVDSEFELQLF